jgi:integrase/recombinase XerD
MREDLLQAYLEELKREGKSENTLDAYRRDLVRLLSYLEEEALELEEFNEVEVSNFISYLLDQEMSRSTR